MGTYTKIDHILDHKINLNKFKIIKIIQNVFPDQSGLNLAITNGQITEISPNIWKLYNTLLKKFMGQIKSHNEYQKYPLT